MKISTKISQLPRTLLSLILLLACALPAVYPASVARAQDIPIVYEHFNADITLLEDGDMHVRLVQQIRFDDSFSQAFYAIPLDYISSIGNVVIWGAASEEDNYDVNTLDLSPIVPSYVGNNGHEVEVDWNFPTTKLGDIRLFVIEYDAIGTVWVYPNHDFIRWKTVNEDRSGITVNESEVNLTLPDIISMDQVTTTADLASEAPLVRGQTLTFTADDAIPDGTPFTVEAYFPHGLLNVGVNAWQRNFDNQFLNVDVDSYHVDLTINADGTLNAHETTGLNVTDGALQQGTRSLRLLYVDEIVDPVVAVNGQPLTAGNGDCASCFLINTIAPASDWVYLDADTDQLNVNEDNTGVYNLDWYTQLPLPAPQALTTTIDYQAQGVLRVSDSDQLLIWPVVPDFGQPVEHATMRLTLPPGVSAEQITMEGPAGQGSPTPQPDGSLLYTFDGPVVPNAWQIALTLPANATSAEKPLWQQQFEDVMAQADAAAVANARNALILRVLGILAVIVAILAAILWWFRWGRRAVQERLGGYVSEPPSHQSPAVVSYLVDRKASEHGVLGSIFYLASLKLLEIDLEGEIKLRRIHDEPLEGTARLPDAYGEDVFIARHLQILFDRVLRPALPLNQWVALDSIADRLRSTLPEIYASLAGDLQRYYIHVPGSGGDTIPGAAWFVVYATLLALMFFEIIPWYIGFIVGFVALLVFVGWSALRATDQGGYSDEGAVEADKWRRFKVYLQEIKKYGDQGAAQDIIDRYFGYAVALGVENVVLAQTADLGVLRPVWMGSSTSTEPYRRRDESWRPSSQTATSNRPWLRPRPSVPTPPVEANRPTLAGMSAQLGDSLQKASNSIGSLLSTAAGDADASSRTVVVNSLLRRREMEWKPNTPVSNVLDDIMRQSVSDAREIQNREIARRQAASRASESSGGGWDWGSGSSSSSSSSRSSSSFGSSSSSSSSFGHSSSSSSSHSSSSSSSSHSGGGGRSGFR